MTKTSRVAVSIFLISMIILPAIFILGILLPTILFQFVETYFSKYQDFFTILAVSLLIVLLIPPWDAKKRAIVSKTFKRISKSFFRPKPSEDLIFKDSILLFTVTEENTNESAVASEIVEHFLGDFGNFDSKHLLDATAINAYSSTNTLQDPPCFFTKKIHKHSNFPYYFSDLIKSSKKIRFKLTLNKLNLFFDSIFNRAIFLKPNILGGAQ